MDSQGKKRPYTKDDEPLDTFSDEWDPMASDYYEKSFNSYLSGPGKSFSDMVAAKKSTENVRLIFNDIPGVLDKNGLRNLCARVQPNVLKSGVFRTGRSPWGFVEYKTIREAQEVFLGMDRKPPLNLRIRFDACIESKVNMESIRMHRLILQERQRQELDFKSKDNCQFQKFSFPANNLSRETKMNLIEFADDYNFNWKFCAGRGVILPPRQLFLSNSKKPIGPEVENFYALSNLDLDGCREQELDFFGHFSVGFFDDSSTIMELIYKLQRSDTGKVNKICGGRCFPTKQMKEDLQENRDFTVLDDLPSPLEPLNFCCADLEKKIDKSLNVDVGPEGRISRCTVCNVTTANCCSTCYLPFCSISCTSKHGKDHENCACQNLKKSVGIHSKFKSKFVSGPATAPNSDGANDGFASISRDNYLPVSIMEKFTDSYFAELLVDDIVTQFGEPVAFICSVRTQETKGIYNKMHSLHSGRDFDPAAALVQVEPTFEVGAMALAYLNGKLCRVVLDRKVEGGWRCIFIDKGQVRVESEENLSTLPVHFSSQPRLATLATISRYSIPFKELWTKFLQPKRKLFLKNLKVSDWSSGKRQMTAEVSSRSKLVLCHVTISEWLPMSPNPKISVTPCTRVKSKDVVLVSTFCSSNLCYVQMANRSGELCQLQNEISIIKLNSLPLSFLPYAGTIVAVKSAVDGKVYRAMVKNRTSAETVIVFYLDFGNREEVDLCQIYPLPSHIAKMPAEAILLKLAGVPVKPLTLAAFAIWANLVEKQLLLEVQLDPDTNSATLISLETNSDVNVQLKGALADVEQKEVKADGVGEEIDEKMLVPLPPMPLKECKLQKLVILHSSGDGNVTCAPADSPLLRHIFDSQVRAAVKYVATCNEGNYVPYAMEVCLAKASDGLWYRAMNMKCGRESCDVLFVDFGDISKVAHTDLRKMPRHMLSTPCLANVASIFGLYEEDFANPEFAVGIKEFIYTGVVVEALVCKQKKQSVVEIFVVGLLEFLQEKALVPRDRLTSVLSKLEPYRAEIPTLLDPECANLIDIPV